MLFSKNSLLVKFKLSAECTSLQGALLVFRLGVDFLLPLSQEQEQEQEEQEPLTKIYQKGVC